MMRWTVAMAVIGLVGCAQQAEPGETFDPLATGGDDWTESGQTYYARFGGSFTPTDDEGATDGDVDEGSYEGTANGTEYMTVVDDDDVVQCDWVWDTTGITVKDDAGDDPTWDVTCFDGHEARGDCTGWIDADANEGPMQFQLSFTPEYVDDDGLQHGTVYSRTTEVEAWRPYAAGTWDGETVRYEVEYAW